MAGTSACTTYASAVNFSQLPACPEFPVIDMPFLLTKLPAQANGTWPAKRKDDPSVATVAIRACEYGGFCGNRMELRAPFR
jgi:hypothetical protein